MKILLSAMFALMLIVVVLSMTRPGTPPSAAVAPVVAAVAPVVAAPGAPEPVVAAVTPAPVVAAVAPVVTVATPTAAPAKKMPLFDDFYVITDYGSKVIEINSVYAKMAWKLSLRNKSDHAASFTAKIDWLDKNGFVVTSTRSDTLTVPAKSEQAFSDTHLVSIEPAGTIHSVKVNAHVVSQ